VRRCEWCHNVGNAHKRGHSIKNGAWRGHMPIVGARGNPRKGQNKKFGLRPKSKPRAPSRAAPKKPPHIAASALWYLTTLGSCVRSCEPALKVRPHNCTVRNCRRAICVFSKTQRVPPVLQCFAVDSICFPSAGMSVPPPLHDTGANISIHRHVL